MHTCIGMPGMCAQLFVMLRLVARSYGKPCSDVVI
jgi:hypothetical protein